MESLAIVFRLQEGIKKAFHHFRAHLLDIRFHFSFHSYYMLPEKILIPIYSYKNL